jgi:hypothetical protein
MNDKILTKVAKKYLKCINTTVYTGFITVMQNNQYLYNKFSGITRLTHDDAMNDAKLMRQELTEGIII